MKRATKPAYTGHLARSGDVYVGELVDDIGFKITITAMVEEVAGQRRFRLEGRAVAPPAWLRIPLLDDALDEALE